MKRSMTFASGALQVSLIQSMTSAILITYLHQVLVRRNDPELMFDILFRVSPVLMLCCEAALSTIITLAVYIKIFMGQSLAVPWYDFIALIVSITVGLSFYMIFTTLITLNRPVIILMLTLVTLLSIGKILVHSTPAVARLTVASAIYLNHLFEPVSEPRLILSDYGKIFKLITMDLVIISLLGILVYYRIKISDFIGRRS